MDRLDLGLVNPFWLVSVTILYLTVISRSVCSIAFPQSGVIQIVLLLLKYCFFPFVKMDVTFAFFLSLEIPPDCHAFSKMMGAA